MPGFSQGQSNDVSPVHPFEIWAPGQAKTGAGGEPAKPYRLIGPDGRTYLSAAKGALGGNRASKIYGRLDCPAARRAIQRGGYVARRVFFASATDAQSAGYRPCAVCLPEDYQAWKDRDRESG
jgi:hypothetical protein